MLRSPRAFATLCERAPRVLVNTGIWFGEADGLIDSIEPAALIFERIVADAAHHLTRRGGAAIS